MALKSTQTNPYETACYIQEAPAETVDLSKGYKVKHTSTGKPFVIFEATLQTFDCYNRMKRRYSADNVMSVINGDERIQTLKKQNKWRGEWNHPNPEIKGQQFSDIRMTIPAPELTSHFINNDRLEGSKLKATITTHPSTKNGEAVTSEIIDLAIVPSFSVRLLGNMIPNAPSGQPNIRVSKVITFDMVDFPSHPGADADIPTHVLESANILFLKELAQYCAETDETMRVVCESFQITPDEIMGITDNASIIMEQADGATMCLPLKGDIRKEAMSILLGSR